MAAGAQLDHETKNTYTVTVTVRDLQGLNSSIDLTIEVTGVNEAPTFSGVSSVEYGEKRTDAVATYTAPDPEGDEIAWTLAAGGDNTLFAISEDGVLTFVSQPNYEAPGDADTNNIYEVTVTATDDDADSPLADSHDVMVEVTNVEEAATVGIQLSSLQPQVSTAITVDYVDAVGNPLVDADGAAHTGIVDDDRDKDDPASTDIPAEDVTWQWSRSSSKSGRLHGHLWRCGQGGFLHTRLLGQRHVPAGDGDLRGRRRGREDGSGDLCVRGQGIPWRQWRASIP